MYGAMNTEITLLGKTRTQDDNGYPIEVDTSTPVYAEIRSVGFKEFYAAQADTMRAEIIFAINPLEYSDQMQVTYNGKSYRVLRPYTPPRGLTELHCARK